MLDTLFTVCALNTSSHFSTLSAFVLCMLQGWYSANSSYTLPKFEAFLRRRYKNIDALNHAWGDTLKTFHDHELRDRMTVVKGLKARQHLDWGQFNNARVTEWFLWLCNAAKAHAGSAGTNRIKCLVKASNGESPLGVGHPSGIDRLALSSGLDLNGCDTRAEFVTGQSHQPFPQLPTSREAYAMDWIGMQQFIGAGCLHDCSYPHFVGYCESLLEC